MLERYFSWVRGEWPTYMDEDDVERCIYCNHACKMHEQICFGQDHGWKRCTCGLSDVEAIEDLVDMPDHWTADDGGILW